MRPSVWSLAYFTPGTISPDQLHYSFCISYKPFVVDFTDFNVPLIINTFHFMWKVFLVLPIFLLLFFLKIFDCLPFAQFLAYSLHTLPSYVHIGEIHIPKDGPFLMIHDPMMIHFCQKSLDTKSGELAHRCGPNFNGRFWWDGRMSDRNLISIESFFHMIQWG